jgi:hypothetical protein
MKNTLVIAMCVVLVGAFIFFGATPGGVAMWTNWFHAVQKVDDATNYETLKKVEDTCRSMIASYESDKLTYEQYKNSENPDQLEWAAQAKMRANKTASSYNNYILKNSYVWRGSVPSDIYMNLPYVE